MYYEINVSKNGQHFFATAERSIRSMEELQRVYPEIARLFTAADGYEINVRRCYLHGEEMQVIDGKPVNY